MRATASFRRNRRELAWLAFAVANLEAMLLFPEWETVPFHLIWISLTLLWGFRIWGWGATFGVLGALAIVTGIPIMEFAHHGSQTWGELFEVPLMSGVFLAMAWHARRRQEATRLVEEQARQQASLRERQERFLHDASHELRTPVTIARGHLEVLRRIDGGKAEIDVALDELARIEQILERLLLLAKADQSDFVVDAEIDLDVFLDDLFLRWSEVSPRVWRLGGHNAGTLRADPEGLRIALDALLENAVEHTTPAEAIELRAVRRGGDVLIQIVDEGRGVPPEALGKIFDRFARADPARTRTRGGVGLGLAIVDAIMKAHDGRCEVATSARGSTFGLRFPAVRVAGSGAFLAAAPVLLGGAGHVGKPGSVPLEDPLEVEPAG
jgi:signal transduction histidine kinase